jgi:hypothetical protein
VPKRATANDPIVVGAHLTPEEIEDGKITDAYQPVYGSKQSECEQVVKLCATQIIPMAERSKFDEHGIGCFIWQIPASPVAR